MRRGEPSASRAASSAFDELARRAAEVGGFPVAWISVLAGEREEVRGRHGTALRELEGEASFAPFVLAERRALFIEDVRASEWRLHALAGAAMRARFVGAVPLVSREGRVEGLLMVVDRSPRVLTREERTALANLASLAMARAEAEREPRAPSVHSIAEAPGHAGRLAEESRQRRAAEERHRQEAELLEAVIGHLGGAFFLVSEDGQLLRWNAALAEAIGYNDGEIRAMRVHDFVAAHDRPHLDGALRQAFEDGAEIALEAGIVDRDGNVRPFALAGRGLRLAGRPCAFCVARDITLRKRAEQQMLRAKERLDLALTSSSLALWDWDLRQGKVYFNENWAVLLGEAPRECTFTSEEVLGWNHAEDRPVFSVAFGNAVKGVSEEVDCEYRVPNARGEWIWIHSRGKVTQRDPAGQALRMTGTSTDITKRKLAEERAEYLATRDALTGLPNRILLHDRLEQVVVNAARTASGFAFMFIDLDRFKTINDSLGHHVGDELLKAVAARLAACVRASDTVARLGGDEFAVILENLRDDDDEGAQQVAEKMVAAMAAPMMVGPQPMNTSCSIGISLYPADGRDSATLMKNADVAMYYAKEKGRNNYQFFSAEMNARAQERLSVENYLRLALRRQELVLHYQPRMEVATGRLVGVEALIRWQHPRRGLLLPGKFIEVAEDSGLIVPIGEWVLETACAQARAWQRRLAAPLCIAVNLSVGQLRDGERLLRAVQGAVRGSGIAPETLELELTESHLMQHIEEKAALLHRLGELGVGIAIDDFGTGYSSLSYLKQLPVDCIKIDGSFVRDIGEDPDDEAIVTAILAMAHSLRLLAVAEGVETAGQLALLRELGCDGYQGFLESPALPAAEFEKKYL